MYMYTVSDTVYRNTCTCNYESNQRYLSKIRECRQSNVVSRKSIQKEN